MSAHGHGAQRTTILNFRLPHRATVIFTVTQVSPVCRLAGSFRVGGRAGLNRIPFTGRVRGRVLQPGTYRLTAHVAGRGTFLRVTVVVFDSGAPTPSQLESARRSNVCRAGATLASNATAASGGSGFGLSSSSTPPAAQTEIVRNQTQATPSASSVPAGHDDTVRAAAPFTPARISKNVSNPLVILALALAVFLLGLAALPKAAVPDPRLTYLIARHRVEIALAGAGAFAVAILALALA